MMIRFLKYQVGLVRCFVIVLLIGFVLLGAIGGCNESNGSGGEMPDKVQNEFTPIIASFVTRPVPVLGSDGKYYLTYELQLTNANSFTWLINSLEVLNADNHNEVLLYSRGDTVTPNNQIMPGRIPSDTLARSETSIFFITFSVESIDDIPEEITHRFNITVPGGIPDAFLNFLSLPPGTPDLIQILAKAKVSESVPIVIGPPLKGTKWIAADGCCISERHVRAVMPINGEFVISQRFAIDWEKLDDQNRIYVGDPLDVTSYFAYGQEILSASEGRVVIAVDMYDDQIPGELPPDIQLAEGDGNHIVIDMGGGNFALYAHMKKGTITVKEGDFVTRGQVLGLLGNSGNTSAPHLHFHVMSGPSTFGSDGIPYVIDEYELIGKAESIEAFDDAEINGTTLEIFPVSMPGIHKDDLPLDIRIVNFP